MPFANKKSVARLFRKITRRIRLTRDGFTGKSERTRLDLKRKLAAGEQKRLELKQANARQLRELQTLKQSAQRNAVTLLEFKRKSGRLERKVRELNDPLNPANPAYPSWELIERARDAKAVRLTPDNHQGTRDFRKLADDIFRFFRGNRLVDHTLLLNSLVPVRHGDFTRNALDQTEILLRLKDKTSARSYAYALLDTPGMEKIGQSCMVKVALSEQRIPFAYTLFLSLGDSHVLEYLPDEWIVILAETDPQEFLSRAAKLFGEEPRDRSFEFYFALAQKSYTSGDAILAVRILAWLETGPIPESLEENFRNFRESLSRLIHARISAAPPQAPADSRTIRIGLLDYKNPQLIKTSRNIGDYVQTLALLGNVVEAGIRNQCRWGTSARKIIGVAAPDLCQPDLSGASGPVLELECLDRDFMSASQNIPKTWVIAYGWYMHAQFDFIYDFPFPANVRPVFLSFHINRPQMLTEPAVAYLRAHGPIGCRDWSTVYLLRDRQVAAFFSGCMTMTLNKLYQDRPRGEATRTTVAWVDVPRDSASEIPADGPATETIAQEVDAVRQMDFLENMRQAKSLLNRYRHEFAAVRTSRLHCYLPCRALGVPVEFVAKPGKENDVRFEGLIGISQSDFEATRDAIQAKLAGLFDTILAGKTDEEVYRGWRESCRADLERAEQYCALGQEDMPRFGGIPELVAGILAGKQVVAAPNVNPPAWIEVSLALDQQQLAILPNVLRSIVAHTQSHVRFHLLTRGLTAADLLAAGTCVDGHEMILYPMDRVDYGAGLKTTEHITVSTMDRLLLPHLLPHLDKVVYLDTDILVRSDIRELFDVELGDLPLAARSSLSETWKTGHHLVYRAAKSLPAEASFRFRRLMHRIHSTLEFPVFNAGVLVLNLNILRRDEFCSRFLTWADIFQLNDQDILNCYCGDRRGELPGTWNAFPTQEILDNPSLVHWAGPLKPWSAHHTIFKAEWQQYSLLPPVIKLPVAIECPAGLIPLPLGKRRFYLNPDTVQLEAVQQQLSSYSQPSRHLELLRNLKANAQALGLPANLSILSFGCSEGFECLDIRSHFPEARISGCDINPEALTKARERCPDDIALFLSNDINLREHGPYDVVIAFNVFCCHPESAGLDDIAGLYPQRTMETAVCKLVEQLPDGGILGIYNSPYFIESCGSLISTLRPLPNAEPSCNGWIEKCDADGHRLCDVTFTFENQSYARAEWAATLRSAAFKDRGIHPNSDEVNYVQTLRPGCALPGSLTTTFWLKCPPAGCGETQEFTQNWTNNFESSLDALFPRPVETPFLCAEIGCFEGKGSLLMASRLCRHPESRLYCIDPWDDVYAKTSELFNTPKINSMCVGQFARFVNNTQAAPKIIPMRGISDAQIPELPDNLDFVYIDGDHSPDQVYQDACNVLPKLCPAGIILFDDYLFSYNGVHTGEGIDRFLNEYADELEIIFKNNQVAVRKAGGHS